MYRIIILVAMVVFVSFGTFNANAASVCVGMGNQVRCIEGNDAQDLFNKISSINIPDGRYFVLVEKSVANELGKKFKGNKRIYDVSLKIFTSVDEELRHQFERVSEKSYYSLEIELRTPR